MDVNVLDGLLAESGMVDSDLSATGGGSMGGSIRDQLLASFFRR
jgi:hypothetical protein